MRTRALLAVAALTVGGFALPAASANAVSVDVTCTGTETVNYDPGLLLSSQTVHGAVHGVLGPCTSTAPGITAGNYAENFNTTLSCATLLAGRAGTRTFKWSDGSTSTFAFTRAINNAAGQTTVTFTGDITSGRFAGDTVVEQVVFVTPSSLECLAPPGLTALGPGPAVLNISRL